MLKASIPDLDNLHKRLGIDDFSWIEEFSGDEGVFTQLIQEYEKEIIRLNKILQEVNQEMEELQKKKRDKKL